MSKYGRKRYDADIKRKEPGTNEKENTCPDVNTIPKLAEVFGISVDELMQINTESQNDEKKDITSLVNIILKAIATLAKKDEDNKRFVPDEVWGLGYHIAKRCTGNGYATEAVSAFLPVIAKAANLTEIYGICLAENKASNAVMKNCYFMWLSCTMIFFVSSP